MMYRNILAVFIWIILITGYCYAGKIQANDSILKLRSVWRRAMESTHIAYTVPVLQGNFGYTIIARCHANEIKFTEIHELGLLRDFTRPKSK